MKPRISSRHLVGQLIACQLTSLTLLGCDTGEIHSVKISANTQTAVNEMFLERATGKTNGKPVQASTTAWTKR